MQVGTERPRVLKNPLHWFLVFVGSLLSSGDGDDSGGSDGPDDSDSVDPFDSDSEDPDITVPSNIGAENWEISPGGSVVVSGVFSSGLLVSSSSGFSAKHTSLQLYLNSK